MRAYLKSLVALSSSANIAPGFLTFAALHWYHLVASICRISEHAGPRLNDTSKANEGQ